jgi:hypothetical protein
MNPKRATVIPLYYDFVAKNPEVNLVLVLLLSAVNLSILAPLLFIISFSMKLTKNTAPVARLVQSTVTSSLDTLLNKLNELSANFVLFRVLFVALDFIATCCDWMRYLISSDDKKDTHETYGAEVFVAVTMVYHVLLVSKLFSLLGSLV